MGEYPISGSHLLSHSWVWISQSFLDTLLCQFQPSSVLDVILVMRLLIEQRSQPASRIISWLHVLILTCQPDVLHYSNVVGDLADYNIHGLVTSLRAYLFGASTKLDEILKENFDHWI